MNRLLCVNNLLLLASSETV